jgi:Asp-tRNA(Asn)/Glu-tRNA(Gln) amidotransferase A subunit family amidase
VPVGVKDVLDTSDMPTENGTALHAGRRPAEDAHVVSLLRRAGAVILGKTVTTELAAYHPGKTRNPHDPTRTPGGSSSGSAAAVADRMVPLALGTQTNGSVIRPAAYCGVFGYKPTRGLISRHGALVQSLALDQIGLFARTVEDLALLAEPLMAFDARDPAMRPVAPPALQQALGSGPPRAPRLAFVRTPVWAEALDDTKLAFERLVGELRGRAVEVLLPPPFADAVSWHRTLMEADMARSFAREYAEGEGGLSQTLRAMIERGRTYLAVDYNRALEGIETLNRALDDVFAEHDAILTPAATGGAPAGVDTTGSPIFCTLWTFCGVPAATLPLLRSADGMPLGVQLVGRRGEDARLLWTAAWLWRAARGRLPETP